MSQQRFSLVDCSSCVFDDVAMFAQKSRQIKQYWRIGWNRVSEVDFRTLHLAAANAYTFSSPS